MLNLKQDFGTCCLVDQQSIDVDEDSDLKFRPIAPLDMSARFKMAFAHMGYISKSRDLTHMILCYTVSHFSYAQLFQGPHFLTKKWNGTLSMIIYLLTFYLFDDIEKMIGITHANHFST